jgi:TonB family protein
MRSGCACLAFVWACAGVGTAAQSTLPDADRLWVVGAQAMRQPNMQAPLQLKLNSGTRITVSPQDVHDPATVLVRRAMTEQKYQAVPPSLLFVLHIRELTPVSKSDVNVTLASGAVLRVPSSDVNDARLTFLRTTLAQARSGVAAVRSKRPAPEGAEQPALAGAPSPGVVEIECGTGNLTKMDWEPWLRRFMHHIRSNWLIPAAAQSMQGQVQVKFVVHREGSIADVTVIRAASVQALNVSARNAVLVSNPTIPLPPEYPGSHLVLCMTFYFNETPREKELELSAVSTATSGGWQPLNTGDRFGRLPALRNGPIPAGDSRQDQRGFSGQRASIAGSSGRPSAGAPRPGPSVRRLSLDARAVRFPAAARAVDPRPVLSRARSKTAPRWRPVRTSRGLLRSAVTCRANLPFCSRSHSPSSRR